MPKEKGRIVNFKCMPFRCTFDNKEDYRMYACDLSGKNTDNVKQNSYGNYTIVGNLHELGIGIEYEVEAREEYNSTYKYSYRVISIERDIPSDERQTRLFLNEILTYQQTEILMSVYPDIVDRVMNDRLSDVDLKLTKGIKEYTFNVIKKKIIENFALSRMFKEFDGLISFDVLKRLADKYPSSSRIKEELSKDPYKCLCELSRIGFKTADGILLEMERQSNKLKSEGRKSKIEFEDDLKTSIQRMKSCIVYILDENEKEGNTKIGLKSLKSKCSKLTPKCMDKFNDAVKEFDDVKITKDGNVSNLKIYERESYIAYKILNAIENPIEWNFETEKYRQTEEGSLTNEQFSLLNNFQKNSIHMLIGYAGSGKSFTTSQLIKMLDDNRKSYTILAPTGRASKVISKYTKRNASTIHRGLGYNPMEGWYNNHKRPLFVDVVIVDETSMADTDLFYRLVDAIDLSRTKLLIIGDPAQLPSVGCGNVLHDLIQSKIVSKTELTKVFRYGVGGLSTVATNIRNMENYININSLKPQVIGQDKAFTFIPSSKTNTVKNCVALYKKLLEKGYKPEDIMVLSAYNKGDYGTVELNKYLQKIANSHNISSHNIQTSNKSDVKFYKDDLVIQCVNNYKAQIFESYKGESENKFFDEEPMTTFISNGDIGIVSDIHKDKNECKITFDENIKYSKEDLQMIKLAYSISVHKSQGGQARVVIFLTPSSHQFMLNSNLLYVGVTRAQEKCFQIGEPQTIVKSVKKKENFKRQTNILGLLQNKETCEKEYNKFIEKYRKENEEKDEFCLDNPF